MSKKSNKPGAKIAIGAAVAAATGYVAGILTAPKSGRDTRKNIKKTADKKLSDAEKQLKKLHTQLDETLGQARSKADKATGKAKTELDSAIETSKKAKEKIRQLLSAVHEGENSQDKDLRSAVKDAEEAIKHLKSFIKK